METYFHDDPRIRKWINEIIERIFSVCILTGVDSEEEFQKGCQTVMKLTSLLRDIPTVPSEFLADGVKQLLEQQLPDARVINNFPKFQVIMERMLSEGIFKVTGTEKKDAENSISAENTKDVNHEPHDSYTDNPMEVSNSECVTNSALPDLATFHTDTQALADALSEAETKARADAEALVEALAQAETYRADAQAIAEALAQSESKARADAEAYEVALAQAETRAKADAEAYEVALAQAETQARADAQALGEALTQAKTDAETLAEALAHAETYRTDAESLAEALAQAETQAKADAEALAEALAQAETQARTDAETLAEALAHAETYRADSEALAEVLAQAETKARAVAEAYEVALTEAETQAKAEAVAIAEALTQAETKAREEAEVYEEALAQAEIRAKADAQALADALTQAEIQVRADALALTNALAQVQSLTKAGTQAKADALAIADALAQVDTKLEAIIKIERYEPAKPMSSINDYFTEHAPRANNATMHGTDFEPIALLKVPALLTSINSKISQVFSTSLVPQQAELLRKVLNNIFPKGTVYWNKRLMGQTFLAQIEDVLICLHDPEHPCNMKKFNKDGWKVLVCSNEDLTFPRRLEREIRQIQRSGKMATTV